MVENCAGNLCPISREMFRQPASRALKRSFIPTLHSSHCCGGFWYIYSLNQFGLLSLQPHFTKKDWAKPNRYLCDLGGKKETHVIVDTFYSLKKRGLGGQQKINVFVLNLKYLLFNQIHWLKYSLFFSKTATYAHLGFFNFSFGSQWKTRNNRNYYFKTTIRNQRNTVPSNFDKIWHSDGWIAGPLPRWNFECALSRLCLKNWAWNSSLSFPALNKEAKCQVDRNYSIDSFMFKKNHDGWMEAVATFLTMGGWGGLCVGTARRT